MQTFHVKLWINDKSHACFIADHADGNEPGAGLSGTDDEVVARAIANYFRYRLLTERKHAEKIHG